MEIGTATSAVMTSCVILIAIVFLCGLYNGLVRGELIYRVHLYMIEKSSAFAREIIKEFPGSTAGWTAAYDVEEKMAREISRRFWIPGGRLKKEFDMRFEAHKDAMRVDLKRAEKERGRAITRVES